MPYFMCDRCAVKLYSAASETECTNCGTPLGGAEQLVNATPLPRPLRGHRLIRPQLQALTAEERRSG